MAESLFDMLQKDHDTVRGLLDDMSDTSDGAEKTRRDLLSKLKDEIVPHMRAEEQVFYSRLKESEESRETALEAIEEHQVAEKAMNDLEQTQPSDERWQAKLSVLQELIDHHIEEEESEIFDEASELFDEDQLKEIGQEFQQAKKSVKSGAMA